MWQNRLWLLLLSFIMVLNGCMVGPDFHPQTVPGSVSYASSSLPSKTVKTSGAGGASQYFVEAKDVPAEWWKLFHSSEINQLIVTWCDNSIYASKL